MIAIIDYGLGNIRAFANVYKRLNIPVTVAKTPADLVGATKLILPGVGAFDHAMKLLQEAGMREPLDQMVLQQKVPVLGICVGMQILAQGSDEGTLPGLGWVPGRVRAFRTTPEACNMPLPHMGWNDVQPSIGHVLFKGMEHDARFYFLHSYYYECDEPHYAIARAFYGVNFSCAVQSENVFGVQFHPEKSHHFGVNLLKNFAEL